jgi:hypothetical protein
MGNPGSGRKAMKMFTGLVLAMVAAGSLPGSLADETTDLTTFGGMGKGERVLGSGEEAVLFEYEGKGCLHHLWFGGNFEGVEETRIRYFVDGEETASIDMNLYLGHGIGFESNTAPWLTKYIGKIGKRNGIHNNYPIPFGKSIRLTAQRSAEAERNPQIWWIVRGTENLGVSLGGVALPETARLKLHRLEGYVANPLEEFNLFDVEGKGALFQVTIAAKSRDDSRHTFLEACMRGYHAQAKTPTMLSSGLEDYFLGTYYFDTGMYHGDTAGLTHFDKADGSFSAYRFHDADPLFFNNGFRLTCRNGETEHGTTKGGGYLSPPYTRFSTYAWVYQW